MDLYGVYNVYFVESNNYEVSGSSQNGPVTERLTLSVWSFRGKYYCENLYIYVI